MENHAPTRASQLADELRERIRRGEYPPGRTIPPERELSASTGFSRTTVRRAIQLLTQEGLLEPVPGSGTYVRRAANVVQPAIGLIVPSFINPAYGELAHAIEIEAKGRGYQLLVGQSEYTPANEANYLLRFGEHPWVKGVLVVTNVNDLPLEAYRFLEKRGIPCLFVSRMSEEVEADSVVSDRVRGMVEAVRYLIALGHRHIAYVRGVPPEYDSHYIGYRRALQEAGIEPDPRLFISLTAGAEEAGREGTRLLLEQGVPFTAICARNDLTAAGALSTLLERGIEVPGQVSLIGNDNTELGTHLRVPLTTVDHWLGEVGRLSVRLLFDRIEGKYTGAARHLTIRPRLVVRASCAPPTVSVFGQERGTAVAQPT